MANPLKDIERFEERLDVFCEREADEAIRDLEQGKPGKAKKALAEIARLGRIGFIYERREAGMTSDLSKKRALGSLSRLWVKIESNVKSAERLIDEGKHKEAIEEIRTIKKEVAAEFSGELAAGRS